MFDYKKHSRSIMLGFIFSTIIILGIYLALIYLYRPLYIPAEYQIKNTLEYKMYNYSNRDKAKRNIIIAAGSNAIYGVHTPVIEKIIDNYNIFNFAIHAGLPMRFYYDLINKVASDGDIVVLPIEYSYITQDNVLTDWHYNQFSTWARDLRYILTTSMRCELFAKNVATYWQRLINFSKVLPVENIDVLVEHIGDDVLSSTTNGPFIFDLLASGDYLLNNFPNTTVMSGAYLDMNNVSEDFVIDFKKFVDNMNKKNVDVYVSYAVSQRYNKFDITNKYIYDQFIQYDKFFEEMGVKVIGKPEFYNLGIEYFYDTHYHLNAVGSILRSLFLAEDINVDILGGTPSYNNGEEDMYFEQMATKAKLYIDRLEGIQKQIDIDTKTSEWLLQSSDEQILTFGTKILIADIDSRILFTNEWSFQEDWGRWTDGTNAELTMNVAPDVKGVELHTNMFMPDDKTFDLNILVNGIQVLSEKYIEPQREIDIPLPQEVIDNLANDNVINIELQMPNATVSPNEIDPNSDDGRKLGIGLIEIEVYGDKVIEKTVVASNKSDSLPTISIGNKVSSTEFDKKFQYSYGWSSQEDWGRWTDGTNAELTIKVTSDVKGVKLRSNMFMPGDSTFDLNILVNGTQVLSESYTQPVSEINIPLPQEVINNLANNNIINIELQMPNVASPKELGLSEDSRKLGIGLKEFEIY